jgi:hypothetical protein
MEYTDKSQTTLAQAIQLAKDHAHVQGMSLPFLFLAETYNTLLLFPVHPIHLAFVLLNEGTSDSEPSMPGGPTLNASPGLFASVIARAGGDPVSASMRIVRRFDDLTSSPGVNQTRNK